MADPTIEDPTGWASLIATHRDTMGVPPPMASDSLLPVYCELFCSLFSLFCFSVFCSFLPVLTHLVFMPAILHHFTSLFHNATSFMGLANFSRVLLFLLYTVLHCSNLLSRIVRVYPLFFICFISLSYTVFDTRLTLFTLTLVNICYTCLTVLTVQVDLFLVGCFRYVHFGRCSRLDVSHDTRRLVTLLPSSRGAL